MQPRLDIALKEWAIVVDALGRGDQLLLLRKGGIAEDGGVFRLEHREFLFYPTFEHQHRDLIRPEFHPRFEALLAEGPNRPGAGELTLAYCARAEEILIAENQERLWALRDHFLWNERYLEQRFRYKPHLPLYLVFLRVSRLTEPARLAVLERYAGCKSWVVLDQPVSTASAQPVLDDARLGARMGRLRELVRGAARQPVGS